jgi:2-polyprenyl-6-methoxyphenol hydroxylase-like FAD-dependent oxidoreductase
VETEVLIVGAGPVGLTLAAALTRYGVSVRILDKAAERSDQSRALVVWSRTLELLDHAGWSADIVAAGLKVSAANIVSGSKTIARIELGKVATPHPYAVMLPQSEIERLLEARLNALGVRVERGVEMLRFAQGPGDVATIVHNADGSEEKIRCLWLVGCDGAHSAVRHELRMVFTGDTLPSSWILADVRLRGMRNPDEIEVGWHADGMLAIFPLAGGRHRVMADLGPSEAEGRQHGPTLREVQELLDQRGRGGITASEPSWLATFRINERKVVSYREHRVFLAGDAAHIFSPAGAQGMNTGMQDAFNLAWKLALVCRGICAEEPLLGSYSSERSEVGQQVLKTTGRIASLALLRGDLKQTVRNHVASLLFGFAPARNAMADVITEVSIDYLNSPLNGREVSFFQHPAVGERVAIRAGEPPFGSGDRPRFVLCAGTQDAAARSAAAVLVGLYGHLVEETVRAPFSEGGMWLVRPDGYVALATRVGDWDDVAAYLDRIASRR